MDRLSDVKSAFSDLVKLGEETRTPLKQGYILQIADSPKISITNNKTENKKTHLIFNLEKNHIPFLLKNDGYGHSLKELDKTPEQNQFQGNFQKGDTIQVLEIEPKAKKELPIATVKIVGLRANGSITLEHSVHKWIGLLV